ncbi:hypothetical protein [Saccharicrinis fermentans]|uniref:Uncharacterized protein n=1 Tax=Saccharicrinis fermentans DSM 9555 = JCM 21142 TaxID=869213 RepID=W7Y9B5_9BACT|nr:hypothetical protein [Saccharicrinis fermentans]GAF04932.1 hypothetical protein JCM21142_93655 [Saccharicrinis fermentans DSM 9555 = JCM 21142]
MISIVPGGGLANRMRAIDSAIALTRNTVKIIWLKNKDLNCDFYQLFKPHHLFRVVDFNYSKFYAYPNYLFCRAKKLKYLQEIVRKFLFNQVFTNPDIEEINSKGGSGIKNLKSNKMFIETCERFDNTKKMHEIFIPTDAIQSRSIPSSIIIIILLEFIFAEPIIYTLSLKVHCLFTWKP